MPVPVDRDRHGQRVSSSTVGDCFRASMSVILDVPNGDHLPNTHGPDWVRNWWKLLDGFGLSMETSNAKGPIWKSHRWVASVPSKNHDGATHAIVMEHTSVVFDPSPKRRYRRGVSLLAADIVLAGTWLEVADSSKLGLFVDWQNAHRVPSPNAASRAPEDDDGSRLAEQG